MVYYILTAIATIGAFTIFLAILLVVANRFLHVWEDPRIDETEEMLPHANCGACGYVGCRPFAEALVAQKTTPGACTVGSEEERTLIADYLGVDVGSQEKRVARLACAGGNNVALMQAKYSGLDTCRAAALVAGGGKGCTWGCLGLADCADVCDFDAIQMNEFSLPVVDVEKCTACNDCVVVCPKDLFSIQPISHRLWVACKNEEAGDEILEDCLVGCTACARCEMDALPGLIAMQKNLPVVDYGKNELAKIGAIDRCPTGAIIWFDEKGGEIKSQAGEKIVRNVQMQVLVGLKRD